MNSISEGVKGFINVSVFTLNQPIVKEGIKNIAGTATFVFGLVGMGDIYHILRGRAISTEEDNDSPKWMQAANKTVIVCSKISLIFSAGVSRPGVFIISSLIGSVVSTEQLDRAFGSNTIFAINPWHPRHLVSLAAVVLILPLFVKTTCDGMIWAYKKLCHYHAAPVKTENSTVFLTDGKIKLMTLFNTLTSRPVLHIGNQFGRFLLHRG